MQVEHAIEPRRNGVAGLKHRRWRDDARPLQKAKQNAIRVDRSQAAQQILWLQRFAPWRELAAKGRQRLVALSRQLFQRFFQRALDLAAKVCGIGLTDTI